MKKYTTSEEFEVLDSQQENVIGFYMEKTGKTKVSELSDEEKDELRKELEA